MPDTHSTPEEIAERGEALYEERFRLLVEAAHGGQFLILDIATGEYEIAPDDLTATKRLLRRCPQAVVYGLRIGASTAYRVGHRGLRAGR